MYVYALMFQLTTLENTISSSNNMNYQPVNFENCANIPQNLQQRKLNYSQCILCNVAILIYSKVWQKKEKKYS